MASDDYYRIPNVEKRLVTPPDRETLHLYGKMVNDFINHALRAHLGSTNTAGTAITIPLTLSTDPAVDTDLMNHADDLLISYIRADQSEKKELREEEEKRFFTEYLIPRFGYARGLPYDWNKLDGLT